MKMRAIIGNANMNKQQKEKKIHEVHVDELESGIRKQSLILRKSINNKAVVIA